MDSMDELGIYWDEEVVQISSHQRGSPVYSSPYHENAEPCPDCGSVKSTHICLMHKQGWQSDGQIGSPGAKI